MSMFFASDAASTLAGQGESAALPELAAADPKDDWLDADAASHLVPPDQGGPFSYNRHHPACRFRQVPTGTSMDPNTLNDLAKDCPCQPHIWTEANRKG